MRPRSTRIASIAAVAMAGLAVGYLAVWRAGPEPPAKPALPLASSLAPRDLVVARALRAALPDTIGLLTSGASRTAVERFYVSRGFAPLWIENGTGSARLAAVKDRLSRSDALGLDPADYLDPSVTFDGAPDALARHELQFTVSVLRYARDASQGRVVPSRVSADIEYPPRAFDAARVLGEIAGEGDAAAVLDALHPPHPAFRALAGMLAAMPAQRSTDAEALRATVIANLERWRWMPRELGATHVIANIPDYTLRLIEGGKLRFVARTIVGEPSTATPVFSATMTSITVNPVWNVPDSIAQKEYLPALRNDPNLLHRLGLRLERRSDGTVQLSQAPGEANLLGRIRFNLPNRFLVYLHDTPDPESFDRPQRARSHGCIRVDNPLYFAEALLSIKRPGEDHSPEALWKMFGTAEVELALPRGIPVHSTYQTAFVDDAGRLAIRGDIYRHDAATLAAIAVETRRRETARARQAAAFRLASRKPRPFSERLWDWMKRQAGRYWPT